MLAWDGTFLTNKVKVRCQSVYHTRTYAQIDVMGDGEHINVILASGNTLNCIIDELKTIFHVPKTGSHRIGLDGVDRTIYTVGRDVYDADITDDIHTNANKAYLLTMIQKLLIFRDIAGVSPNILSHIRIRTTEGNYEYPVSCKDSFPFDRKKGIMKHDNSPLSAQVLEKWFVNHGTSPDKVFLKMIPEITRDNLLEIMHRIRISIDRVIADIDPTQSWYGNYVYERIQNRIMSSRDIY